jgi:hypothetical protein
MRTTLRITLAAAAFLLLTSQAHAQSDLTGTYLGKVSCKGVDATGRKESNKVNLLVAVSQPTTGASKADLQVSTQLIDPGTEAVLGVYYWFGGISFDPSAPARKGQGAITECTHLANPETVYQIAHLTYSVTPGAVKGSIKFTSISDFTGIDGAIASCKASLKRVDTAEPSVPYCP